MGEPRLLALNSYFYRRGGAEVVFLEQLRVLEERGWQVAPLAMQHAENQRSRYERYFVEEIEYGRVQSTRRLLTSALKVLYSWEAHRQVLRLVDAFRPDIAHAHNVYHHLSPAVLWALRSRDVPTVLTLHDLKIVCPAYKMLAHDGICERCRGGRHHNVVLHRCVKGSATASALVFAESLLHRTLRSYQRTVDRFIVPSRFYLDKLSSWGMNTSKVDLVPNFVDVAQLRPDRRSREGFVYFGRLAPEKGLRTLVRAAAAAGVRLSVVGDGPEGPALRRLADALGADVRFLGHLTGEELHDAIRDARAAVLPSEWYENAPLSVLEAYALGTPAVCAHIGGLPELVREGETGFTFPPGDIDALAERLGWIAGQPAGRVAELGGAARRWVEAEFSVERHLERLLRVYRLAGAEL